MPLPLALSVLEVATTTFSSLHNLGEQLRRNPSTHITRTCRRNAMPKRGPLNATPEERSKSPSSNNADNCPASESRKETHPGDGLSVSSQASNLYAIPLASSSGGSQSQGAMRPNQDITPAVKVERQNFGGLALPPESAAVGSSKYQDFFKSMGRLAPPPLFAVLTSGGSQGTPRPIPHNLRPSATSRHHQTAIAQPTPRKPAVINQRHRLQMKRELM